MARDDAARWQRLIELLQPIHGAALGTARRLTGSAHDGDDLLQEAVLRAHAKLDSLRDESKFRSWFFAVLLSQHRSLGRRAFWRRFLPLGDDSKRAEPAASHEHGEDGWWRARRVARILGKLPAVQREAIVLHELEGFSVEEVAAMQGATVSAVKSRLSRGRARLRRHYLRGGWTPANPRVAARREADGSPLGLLATSGTSGEEV